MAKRPRNSAKALIVRNGCLLVLRIQRDGDEWLLLPGGGQDHGETLVETIEREVMEETGFKVSVGELVLMREYRSARHEFADRDPKIHQVEFFFKAKIKGSAKMGRPKNPDRGQVAVEWLPLAKVPKSKLYPQSLRRLFAGGAIKRIYQGDVN